MSKSLLFAGACIGMAEAFAPSTAGSLAPRSAVASASSSFCPTLRTTHATAPAGKRGGAAVLSMNLGERFVRLVKANVNDLLTKNEDPEKLLNQIVEDMQVRPSPGCSLHS